MKKIIFLAALILFLSIGTVQADGFLSVLEINLPFINSPLCPSNLHAMNFRYTTLPTVFSPPPYYFRIYGKYPSDAGWEPLWKEQYRHGAPGTYNQQATFKIPEPKGLAKEQDSTYNITIVGRGCYGNEACWPTEALGGYEVKDNEQDQALFIRKTRVVGNPNASNPETKTNVKLIADLSISTGVKEALWTVEPLPTSRTKKSLDDKGAKIKPQPKSQKGNVDNNINYKYDPGPAIDTHGEKELIALVNWNDGGCIDIDDKTQFKLFFRKKRIDYPKANAPNWFVYWPENDDGAVTPVVPIVPVPGKNFSHVNAHDPGTTYKFARGDGSRVAEIDSNSFKTNNRKVTIFSKAADELLPLTAGYNKACGQQQFNLQLGKGTAFLSFAICHEWNHAWVYDQWDTTVANGGWGQAPGAPALDDTDCDGIPDVVEQTVPCFNITRASSFPDFPIAPSSGYNVHKLLGGVHSPVNCLAAQNQRSNHDEEVFISWKCINDNAAVYTGPNDWANPGKQSTPAYYREENPESGTNASLTDSYVDAGVDTDGDGLFNVLRISANISVGSPGTYTLYGLLENDWGELFSADNETAFFPAGDAIFDLAFDGILLRGTRYTGTYNVSLTLLGNETGEQSNYTTPTAFYDYTQFEQPPAELIGSFSELAADSNNNGLYDRLDILVSVNATVEGNYTLTSELHNNNTDIMSAQNFSFLNMGDNQVVLSFDGLALRAQRQDGPYTLKFLEILDQDGSQTDSIQEGYNTSFYNYKQFERPPAEFTGIASDRGIDTNANTFFDFLEVTAEVNATQAGNYTFTAYLSDANMTGITWNSTKFLFTTAGVQDVSLLLDGMPISVNGMDGPYKLSLTLHDENESILDFLPNGILTFPYNYTQFEPASRVSLIITYNMTPAANISVSLMGPAIQSDLSDENGSAVFNSLPTGTYSLDVVPSPSTGLGRYTDTLSLSLGEQRQLNVSLSAVGMVMGRVTDANGSAVSTVLSSSSHGPWSRTDENGGYIIPYLPEGEHRIYISSGMWYIFVDGRFYGYGSSALVPVNLSATTVVDFTQQFPSECTDADGDGFYANCPVFPDCDDQNATWIGMKDGTYLNGNKLICPGTYRAEDPGENGVMIFNSSSITLNCNGAELIGNDFPPQPEVGSIGINFNGKQNLTIRNCTVQKYYTGASLSSSNGNKVENFIVDSNNHGLHFYISHNNLLQNITATNNYYGFYLGSSDYNTFQNITANNNTDSGFYIYYSSNNNLSSITANNNRWNGLAIVYFYSSYNTLTSITANNNYKGFNIDSRYTTFQNITANNNGIGIFLDGDYGILRNITANNNGVGLVVTTSSYDSISSITANNNSQYGLRIYYSSNNNLSSSTFISNGVGIFVEPSRPSNFNTISNNYFNNTINAVDSAGTNYWNKTRTPGTNIIGGPYLGGNFWSGYNGTDTNSDGIGDTYVPYTANGGIAIGGDYLPLVLVSATDLIVSAMQVPPIMLTGRNYSVPVFTMNNGTGTTPPSITRVSIGNITVAEISVPSLGTGETYSGTALIYCPSAGRKTVLAIADAQGTVQETNEQNNERQASVTCMNLSIGPRPQPNFTIESIGESPVKEEEAKGADGSAGTEGGP